MNKQQKQSQQHLLQSEQEVINELEKIYQRSKTAVNSKVRKLEFKIGKLQTQYDWAADAEEKAQIQSLIQSKIYQKQYQEQLKAQLDTVLDKMHQDSYTTVSEYLDGCYTDGFIGTLYDLNGQGIPVITPINQRAMTKAIQLDSKISTDLYTKLGHDVDALKKSITEEVSRGIATNSSYSDVATSLSNRNRVAYNKAIRIARTEGHRVQTTAAYDAMLKAKQEGADILKQWDAALDKRTRKSHARVDGEIRELDEKFSNGLMFPGDPDGKAAEVINCRCALLQRARWDIDDEELETLKERAEYFGLDKANTLDDYKAKFLAATVIPPVVIKKEYLTKKKLEEKIADIEAQQKTAKTQAEIDDLEKLKAEYQTKLDEKIVASETKKLKKESILLQDQLDNYPIDTYSNIWKDDVTTKDWASKQYSITAKKQYFEDKLKYATNPAEISKWQGLLDSLDDFDKKGAEYYKIQTALTKTKADLTKLQKNGKIVPSTVDDAFTDERKNAALWAKSTKTADTHLRDKCGNVWKNGTSAEKYAIYDYTQGSGKFNRPLSGFEKPYAEYGTGWEPKWNKGVGKVWIDYEGAGDEIRNMTNLISKSSYDFDMWMQHGCQGGTMESFLGISPDTFERMTESQLQQFVGRSNRRYSFMSCGVSKGTGFSSNPVIINVYAPKGTQMMYAEPFSYYGKGGKLNWDGVAKQSYYGGEAEIIIQRGASYTITKVEKTGGKIYVDMEVHPEKGYDLIQQDPNEWKGSTKKGR